MGGLLARYYIHEHRPKNLGKVVMLGTPNQGSDFADAMCEKTLLRHIFNAITGPVGQEFKTDYEHTDGPIDYPLGVIAGSKSINPVASLLYRDGVHDGIVPVDRTKIEGMTDHVVIPASHTFMMYSKQVMDQTAHFLKHEKFEQDGMKFDIKPPRPSY